MDTLQEPPAGGGLIVMPAPPTFMMSFPPEVTMMMARYCREADLAVMARSGSALRSIAETELYREIEDSVFVPYRFIDCLRAIAARPSAAAMVRSINIYTGYRDQAYWYLLASVLPMVLEIVALRLPDDLPWGPFLVPHCLGATSPNRTLRKLCGPEWLVAVGGIPGLDTCFDFLAMQTNLVSLQLLDSSRSREPLAGVVATSASRLYFPKLRWLKVSSLLLPHILKTNLEGVRYLNIDAQDGIRADHPVVLAKQMRLLQLRIVLYANTAGETLERLARYSHHFPSITVLEIDSWGGCDPENHAEDFMNVIATFIEDFPNLLALIVCPLSTKLIGLQNLRALSNHCPTLRCVSFSSRQFGRRVGKRIGDFWEISTIVGKVTTTRMAPGFRPVVNVEEAVGPSEWALVESDMERINMVLTGWWGD